MLALFYGAMGLEMSASGKFLGLANSEQAYIIPSKGEKNLSSKKIIEGSNWTKTAGGIVFEKTQRCKALHDLRQMT